MCFQGVDAAVGENVGIWHNVFTGLVFLGGLDSVKLSEDLPCMLLKALKLLTLLTLFIIISRVIQW